MPELLNVDKAIERMLTHFRLLPSENVNLVDALGRVLAEDVVSDLDLPPFPNSAMDGYAVRSVDVMDAAPSAPVELRVAMDIPAGKTPPRALQNGEAARIMTGAPMPDGADAVVPVEQTDSDWSKHENTPLPEKAQIYQAAAAGQAVRPVGQNIQYGQTVLQAHHTLRPADVGMLAALGQSVVSVVRRPRVSILTSGDELVDVDQALSPGKIRDVNSYTLAALLQEAGAEAIRLPIAGDSLEAIRDLFQTALSHKPDVIISSAGVSVGAADFTKMVLEELGQVNFWRINLRPGKPLAFGLLQDVPFFGLPGNPVSAMVTFDVFVRPALLKLQGREDDAIYAQAITGERITSDGRRSYVRVQLVRQAGKLIATTTGTQSSGALYSMVLADGLLIIPEDVKAVEAGTELTVKLLRQV